MIMFGLTVFGDICVAVAAYAAGAFTWPWLHQKILGAEAYAGKLRDKASAILATARGK
jgi:hypothetical protein